MIRPAMLAAIALGFLTAVVVGELGLLMARQDLSNPPESVGVGQSETVVETFYEGVNAWIATGDRSLELVIAPDFVDHTLSQDPDRNGVELFEHLSAIGAILPSFRYDVLGIESSGSIVSVDLMSVAEELHPIAGWEIALPAQQTFREILRIEGERIAERWSPDDLLPTGSAPIERKLPIGVETYRQPSLQHFTLDPESAFELVASGTVMLWVESGELKVELSGWDQAGTLKYPPEPLAAGSIRFVAPTGELHLRALGEDRVQLWTVSLDQIWIPSGVVGQLTSNLPSGLSQQASVSLAMQLPANSVRLSVQVVTLPVGTIVSMKPASLHEVMVIGGALQAKLESGEVFYCFDRTRSRLLTGAETALSGQGFAVQRGSSAGFQVIGSQPATLILLTIHPATSLQNQPIRTGPD